MPKYSMLMRLILPNPALLDDLVPNWEHSVASLLAQTFGNWELVLVGSQSDLDQLGPLDPRVRTAVATANEPLAWVANRLLDSLGTWVGFLGQGDRLLPQALDQVELGLGLHPEARVVFTDEESINWFGQISMRFHKGDINSLRLRSQEYLRDLALIQKASLTELGGYSRLASTVPTHAAYLEILDAHGEGAFLHLAQRLYQRFRDHRDPLPRVHHDAQAIQEHLTRRDLTAQLRELNGTLEIEYQFRDQPEVTVLIVVDDDLGAGVQRIQQSQLQPVYRPAVWRVLHLGSNPAAKRQYQELCSTLRLEYRQSTRPRIESLNQEAQTIDTQWLLFLQADPINARWLHRLVDQARQGQDGMTGARCIEGIHLHYPGIAGHSYEGWDWNAAGRFDVLTVPQQIAAVSPACSLIGTRRFLQFGGFDPTYPTLYGMELCLRLAEAGYRNRFVPMSLVGVAAQAVPLVEAATLSQAWPNWSDPFELHLPLE